MTADRFGTGCIPVHLPENLPTGNTNGEVFALKRPINHEIEIRQISPYQSKNWLDIMSDEDSAILNENNQKYDDIGKYLIMLIKVLLKKNTRSSRVTKTPIKNTLDLLDVSYTYMRACQGCANGSDQKYSHFLPFFI